jgi:hypothetical protein
VGADASQLALLCNQILLADRLIVEEALQDLEDACKSQFSLSKKQLAGRLTVISDFPCSSTATSRYAPEIDMGVPRITKENSHNSMRRGIMRTCDVASLG